VVVKIGYVGTLNMHINSFNAISCILNGTHCNTSAEIPFQQNETEPVVMSNRLSLPAWPSENR